LTQIDDATSAGLHAFRAHRAGQEFAKSQSLVGVLKRLDGIIQGWGKHYRFCNDDALIQRLDEAVKQRLGAYLGAYADARERTDEGEKQILLGIEKLGAIKRTPFKWPTERA